MAKSNKKKTVKKTVKNDAVVPEKVIPNKPVPQPVENGMFTTNEDMGTNNSQIPIDPPPVEPTSEPAPILNKNKDNKVEHIFAEGDAKLYALKKVIVKGLIITKNLSVTEAMFDFSEGSNISRLAGYVWKYIEENFDEKKKK